MYSSLGAYDVCSINAPFTVQKYIDAIKDAEISGYDVLILDSISAEWAGTGGLLNLHTQITSANRANSYATWGQITPKHNALFDLSMEHTVTVSKDRTSIFDG